MHSGAWKFVEPLESSIYLHKYDLHHQMFIWGNPAISQDWSSSTEEEVLQADVQDRSTVTIQLQLLLQNSV